MTALVGEFVTLVADLAASWIILSVVGLLGVLGAVVLFLVVAAAGAAELRQERKLCCVSCGRGGPWPERVMMSVRDEGSGACPDCGAALTTKGR